MARSCPGEARTGAPPHQTERRRKPRLCPALFRRLQLTSASTTMCPLRQKSSQHAHTAKCASSSLVKSGSFVRKDSQVTFSFKKKKKHVTHAVSNRTNSKRKYFSLLKRCRIKLGARVGAAVPRKVGNRWVLRSRPRAQTATVRCTQTTEPPCQRRTAL